jgi:trigger factor
VVPAYKEAIEEAGIDPFGPAEYELIQMAEGEPMKFKAKVPLAPTVELGNYKGVDVERMPRKVSDEDVNQELETIRQRSAKVETAEGRPVQSGDLAIVRLTEADGDSRETVIEAGKNLPSFDEGLIGMNKDETKSIELIYPNDHEDKEMAGTKSRVTVTVNDIKERQVPELDDDFVKQISEKSEEKIETVDQLKEKIRSAMELAANDLADRKIESEILEKLDKGSKVCFPDVMAEHELDHRREDLLNDLKSRNITIEQYLEATGKTIEEIESNMKEAVERDLRVSIIFGEIAKVENIEVSDEEVEAEITKMAEETGYPRESVAAYVDKTDSKGLINNRLLRRKVLDFLVQASNIKDVGRK